MLKEPIRLLDRAIDALLALGYPPADSEEALEKRKALALLFHLRRCWMAPEREDAHFVCVAANGD
jgi:hypothetical protein